MYLVTGIAAAVHAAPSLAGSGSGATETATDTRSFIAVEHEVERRSVELTTDTALALTSETPFAELSIANPAIADISTISNDSLYLLGKKPGRTTLMIMGEEGQVLSIIDVLVSADISELKARLAEILPGEEIEVFTANDGIVLTGRVSGQAQIDRALAIASHYAPERISNLMTIDVTAPAAADLSAFEPQLREMLPGDNIEVAIVNGGIVLSGETGSAAARDTALALAERFAPGRVTSLLQVSAPVVALPDPEEVARHIAQILPSEDIEVHLLGGALVLSGNASSAEAAQRAVEVAQLAAAGAQISNLIVVRSATDCTVRTRRGGEMVESTIPCPRPDASASIAPAAPDAAASEALSASVQPSLSAGFVRPKARPVRVAVN
jgi:Flp pilus assembly secretin CpaC